MDSFHRSLLKTVIWRVAATTITLITVYSFTGEFSKATTITLTAAALLAVGYYFHERVWDKIEWGRRHGFAAAIQNESFESDE
jgi:uncharacterized membrane protein